VCVLERTTSHDLTALATNKLIARVTLYKFWQDFPHRKNYALDTVIEHMLAFLLLYLKSVKIKKMS
tara:strand:+ start:127 stop:324 length:198 start_codon:yes stop_codon:yes gene_type:complete